MGVSFVLVMTIIIVIVIGLGIFGYISYRESNTPTTDPFNRPQCTASTNDVVSISGFECCYTNGNVTPFRYVEELDLVVGPSPVYYLTACSGFCENGLFDSNTEKCITGSSTKFEKCINITKPVNCRGAALPVAALGTELFYAKSATVDACPCSGACDGTGDC